MLGKVINIYCTYIYIYILKSLVGDEWRQSIIIQEEDVIIMKIVPRSVRTPSDHKNVVSPTLDHSSHFSNQCPNVLQN